MFSVIKYKPIKRGLQQLLSVTIMGKVYGYVSRGTIIVSGVVYQGVLWESREVSI